MTKEARRRRGRLVVAGLSAGALVVALLVTMSVAGGVRSAGAGSADPSPQVFVSGANSLDLTSFSNVSAGNSASTKVFTEPVGQPDTLSAVAINANANRAVVGELNLNGCGPLVRVFTESGAPAGSVNLPQNIVGFAMDPDKPDVAYILENAGAGCGQTPIVAEIGLSPARLIQASVVPATVPFDFSSVTSIAISPDGQELYVGGQSSIGNANARVARIPTGNPSATTFWVGPNASTVQDVEVAPNGGSVYVSGVTPNTVSVGFVYSVSSDLTGATHNVTFNEATPDSPARLAVSPDGSAIFASTNQTFSGPSTLFRYTSNNSTTEASTLTSDGSLNLNALPSDTDGLSGIEGLAVTADGKFVLAFGDNGSSGTPTVVTIGVAVSPMTVDAHTTYGGLGTTTDSESIAIAPDQAPIASISPSPAAVQVGHSLSLSGASSTVAYGGIASYAWTFDDGGIASGQTVSHTFTTVGTHSATVTETDSAGTSIPPTQSGFPIDTSGQTAYQRADASAQTTVTINVTAGPPPPTTSTTLAHHTTTTQVYHAPGTPTLTLNPTVGPPGTIVTVTGSGFARNTPITVAWSVSTGSVVIMSDSHGNLPPSQLFILTPDVLGPRFAQASSTPQATAQFLVVASDSEPESDNPSLLFRSEGP